MIAAAATLDTPTPRTVVPLPDWTERNRQWLATAFGLLARRIETGEPIDSVVEPGGFVPALIHVARIFNLSAFEREMLLLIAGMEMDRGVRAAVATIDPRGPSLGMALDRLGQPHWDALSPDAPLRAWRIMTLDRGDALLDAVPQIDERILHFVAGLAVTDAALAPYAVAIEPPVAAEDLPVIHRVAAALDPAKGDGVIVVLERQDHDPGYRRDVALAVAATMGRPLLWIASADVPAEPDGLRLLALHLDREVGLTGALPLLAVESANADVALGLVARMRARLIWVGASVPGLAALPGSRRLLRFDIDAPDPTYVRDALVRRWRHVAPLTFREDPATLAAFDRAARQFRLGPSSLDGVVEQVSLAEEPAHAVWPAARSAGRGGLDLLAQRVETRAELSDVVLPAGQQAMIRDIAAQLDQRERVYRDWGFAGKTPRGQGLVALFTGESGTGKTLAAEAIANAVALDLYRIDLATMVSKYIGETEKNLKRLFDAAEASGAVLLFDEADALFGKRSEVKDSHDRYANIEVAYLLQRIEAYRGLAILTTNLKGSIDRAFQRRIRFVVPFPFPDPAAREAIWRRQFPAQAPIGAIDFPALARMPLSGGNIRSIALNAAFRAASGAGQIDQTTVIAAAHDEFAKLERNPAGLGNAS
jgi:hypothetical protein